MGLYADPFEFLAAAVPGMRVVIRTRIAGGFTDALGELLALDEDTATVATRHGDVTVQIADVVAAKEVPPAPRRRAPRHPI